MESVFLSIVKFTLHNDLLNRLFLLDEVANAMHFVFDTEISYVRLPQQISSRFGKIAVLQRLILKLRNRIRPFIAVLPYRIVFEY